MNNRDFICSLYALRSWQDGGSEGINGALAVAFAIRNRIRAGFWGGDWITVLSHHRDYLSHDRPYPDEIPDPRMFSFQTVLQEIPNIFNGTRADDITVAKDSIRNEFPFHGGMPGDPRISTEAPVVLYYGRLNEISEESKQGRWFLENICRNPSHVRLAQVGALTFFS